MKNRNSSYAFLLGMLLAMLVLAAGASAGQIKPSGEVFRDLPLGNPSPPWLPEASDPDLSKEDFDFRNAYTLGMQAYVFGFTYTYMFFIRWMWVTQEPERDLVPYAPLNYFWHARRLFEGGTGGGPNNDALYSIAWIDLREEPVILTHPDMGDRYFSFEIADSDWRCSAGDSSGDTTTNNRRTGSPSSLPKSTPFSEIPTATSTAPSPSTLQCGTAT